MCARNIRGNHGWHRWPNLPWTRDLDEVIRIPEASMDTLAAGVRHRRDSGGHAVDQQWQGLGSCGARSDQVITTAVR